MSHEINNLFNYCNFICISVTFGGREVLMYTNYNMDDVITPVNVTKLQQILNESKYDVDKTQYLIDGFSNGFDLGYRGPEDVQQQAANLKFSIGDKIELWNKVMKEVKEQRYAGPFSSIPFDQYIQSPIGLVPKDGGKKTRLIFHLSFPKGEMTSVNANTPDELRHVEYKDFDEAVRLCLKISENPNCAAAKSDLSSAFRQLPIKRRFWKFLVMKAQNPIDGKWYYFFDKNLPFGAAASCKIFQAFSDALAHIMRFRTEHENVNYLDDFLFLAELFKLCHWQVELFLQTCKEIGFPVSLDKTEGPTKFITFLGLLIDLQNKRVCLPLEKINKAREILQRMIRKSKTTLRELQQLCGLLNFLNKAVIPGRTFSRRLYDLMRNCNVTKAHHHLPIKADTKDDLRMWLKFINNAEAYARPFFQFQPDIVYPPQFFYTDASMSGGGGVCDRSWFVMEWDEDFLRVYEPSINYLELYALTIAVCCYIERFKNTPITVFCDNLSVVYMINNGTSRNPNCMKLIRLITLNCLISNVTLNVEYISTKANIFADSLSRLKYKHFWRLARQNKRTFHSRPTNIPLYLQDMEETWNFKF